MRSDPYPTFGMRSPGRESALIMTDEIDLFCVPQTEDTECLEVDHNEASLLSRGLLGVLRSSFRRDGALARSSGS